MRFLIVLLFVTIGIAQDTEVGRKLFESRCASCHGADGMGGEHAPSIVSMRQPSGRFQTDLRGTITKGIPDGGMPVGQALGGNALAEIDRVEPADGIGLGL